MNALIISAVWGVLMMFSGILLKQKNVIRNLSVLGLIILLVVNVLEMSGTSFFNIDTKGMIHFDRYALLFNTVVFACMLIYLILSAKDMEKVGAHYADYLALIFFVLCGIVLVASFESLLILFLGIEILSIPLYILSGTEKRNLKSNEASLKFLLLGAFSTGLMLMGIALIYGASGSFMSSDINSSWGKAPNALMIAGMALLLFSMAFKASVAPFHFWAPDVYDGAPTVFASFFTTVVKGAGFIAFIRLFDEAFGSLQHHWQFWMAVLTAATLFIGNITAVFQQSVKRMLAYSSVAQAGFMMLSLFAMNTAAKEGLMLYIAAYSLATIGIFAVLIKMEDHSFDGFNGFAKSQPVVAAATAICLLSLAGIPLTGGFLSKFYMLKAVTDTHKDFWLVIFSVLMAAISVYYYFRLIKAMYFKEGNVQNFEITPVFKWTMVVVAAAVILLGVFPSLLLNWLYF